ncbi:lipase member I [Plutella xylostella]|uniref:lipase member I n=1 Tax=Plutella xylostella TaxID=51655 RepID=UPI0020326B00|nr:lipase member I [Plutella xylostella]
MFELPPMPDHFKLDRSDAVFVDVIHTCSGVLGAEAPLGHADFYPNSGFAPQPGCDGIQAMFACSHGRSHFLFSESINSRRGFPALRCGSWADYSGHRCQLQAAFMGEGADPAQTGSFYLTTNAVAPFGRALEIN